MESFVTASDSSQFFSDKSSSSLRRLTPPSTLRIFVELFLFSVAYFVTGRLGLLLVDQQNAAHVWIPAGLALSVLWIRGYAYLPGVLVGSLLIDLTLHFSWTTSLLIAFGNMGEAAVGLWLLRKAKFNPRLECVRDVVVLSVLPMPFATLISASCGTASQWFAGSITNESIFTVFATWWLGDAVSIVVVTPVILTWWYWWPVPPARH